MPVGADDPDTFATDFSQQLLAGRHGGITFVATIEIPGLKASIAAPISLRNSTESGKPLASKPMRVLVSPSTGTDKS